MVTPVTSVIHEVSLGTIAAVPILGALQAELWTNKLWEENTLTHIGTTCTESGCNCGNTTTRVANQQVVAKIIM